MRTLAIAVLLLAAGPSAAASFFGTDRLVRAHVDDGAAPGVTEETLILDQLGDLDDLREAFVEHAGAGSYTSRALARHQSSVGGASVSFDGRVEASGTSESGGPDSAAETRIEVDFTLDISESFTIQGAYDLELGNGEVSLGVDLLGGGVSFLASSRDDLFAESGTLAYAGTLEPGTYTLVVRLLARDENLALGADPGGASVSLASFLLLLEPVNVPEPGTALLVAAGLAAAASQRRRTAPR